MRLKKINKVLRVPGKTLQLSTTPIANNTIGNAQSICYNASPAKLVGSTPTGSGSPIYQWQVSTNGSSFTVATGTNNARDYQPGTLTAARWYKRIVSSLYSPMTDSNIIKITVATQFNAGTVAGGGSGRAPYSPQPFSSVAPASGGVGSITYLWQRNFNGGAWGNAPGGNSSATYMATNLTPAGTYKFRRRATNTCGTLYSNEITVMVTP